ncbi:MAG: hypothetical protein PHI15_09870 [Methanomicrobium sp.]|nr:hypothetical protein [Methanomicrobium sp.]
MDTQLIVIFTLCVVTISAVTVPFILSYLEGKREEKKLQREAEERKTERRFEYEARRNREEDLCVLLGNLVKADAAMDYIGSRGGNSERMNAVINLLKERTAKSENSP